MGDGLDYVHKVLGHIRLDKFGQRDAPTVRVAAGTVEDKTTGAITGSLEVVIRTRMGQELILGRESLDGVTATEETDARLAKLLSTVLMNHTAWPR